MNFLYPSFLFGFFAIAIPIAIHLFNFRRTKKVYFTNVEFLRAVKTSTNSFRRLKQWLILAARILFILFLVLTFAQPFIASKNQPLVDGRGVKSIYLDNSLSMQNQIGNDRSLDLATDNINSLLTTFPNSPNFQLITNDFDSKEQYVSSAEKIKDRIAEVGYSTTYRNLADVYRRQASLLERHSPAASNQAFWFSDFQKSTAGDLQKLTFDTLNTVYLIPVQAKAYRNVFLDSVWLSTPFIREMQVSEMNIKLVNVGNENVEDLPIKLFLDNLQVSTASVNIPAKGEATATFNFTVRDKGFKRGRISFEDQPIVFDNEYFFILNASPKIAVTHLYNRLGAGSEVDYVASVFNNEEVFSFQSFNAQNVDNEKLIRSDLVVVEGVTQPDAALKASLDKFVRNGGSLLIIPPAQADAAAYGTWLSSFNIRSVTKNATPTPVTPTPGTETTDASAGMQRLAAPDRKNPFFSDIFENTTQQGNIDMPNVVPLLQWVQIGTRLLSLRDNRPFLTQTPVQKGKVYVCASPLAPSFGNFAAHSLFVPVMYKIATLSKASEQLAYSFQENTIALYMPNAVANNVYKLKKSDGTQASGLELIPNQRVDGNQLIIELPKSSQTTDKQVLESGYYELTLNDQPQRLLALNYDKQESEMDFYSPTELKQLFANQKNVQVFNSIEEGDFVKEFREQNIGVNLWKYCLIAALFFLLVEIALIRLMKG